MVFLLPHRGNTVFILRIYLVPATENLRTLEGAVFKKFKKTKRLGHFDPPPPPPTLYPFGYSMVNCKGRGMTRGQGGVHHWKSLENAFLRFTSRIKKMVKILFSCRLIFAHPPSARNFVINFHAFWNKCANLREN